MPSTLVAYLVLELSIDYAIAYAVTRFAVTYAISTIVTRLFSSSSANQNTNNGVRQQVPPSGTNSIPVVYGDAYLSGVFVDAVLSTDQKTMYYVMAISQISPNGQFTFDTSKFYWQDQIIGFDGTDLTKVVSLADNAIPPNVNSKISGNLFISLYKSNEAGTITSLNGAAAPSTVMGGSDIAVDQRWPSSGRQMNGLAFAIIKMAYNQDAGTTQMQPITFYASHYLNNTGAAKPGDVWYDYITNTKYGCAMDDSIVDVATATALNTYSDATIPYTPSGGGSATQARYRINGVLDTGQNVLSNLDQIMLAADSWNQYNAATGKWSIVINKEKSTDFAFNDTNIIGEIRVSAYEISQSINQIEAQFPNKLNKDQPDYVYLNTPFNLLYANEPDNKYSITYSLVNDSVQAQYLANRMLEQAREDLIVSFATTYNGIQVDAGDVISVTNAAYGWDAKLFRVIKVSEASLPDGNLGAALELNEYNADVYGNGSITAFAPTPNSNLPSATYFSPLTAPTVSTSNPASAIPNFDITISIPATGRVTFADLYYAVSSVPSASDWKLLSTASTVNGQTVTPGSAYVFANQVLPTGAGGTVTYYFGYTVYNEISSSNVSPVSLPFVWSPVGQGPTGATGPSGTGPTGATGPSVTGPTGNTGPTGTAANKYATAFLYQWSPSIPGDPSGASNYTWATGASSSYTGGNGWQTTLPANPGTAGLQLWFASTQVVDVSTATTTSVSWTSGYVVAAYTANGATGPTGASGVQSANPTVYQWAASIPSISGSSTYTWSTGSFTPTPSGWSTAPTTAIPGYTLWSARVSLVDSASATTSSINWSTASILATGYAGGNGLSSRICYARVAGNPTPYSATLPTSGSSSFPSSGESTSYWGFAATWVANDPNPSSTDSLYQSDGIYNPSTNVTTWSAPYISSLKVGSLSAVSVNTGALTVQGLLTVNSAGAIQGGQTGYNSGTGFFLGYSSTTYKFSIGSSTQNILWDGSALTVTGNIYGNGAAIFTGQNAGAGFTTAVTANSTNAADWGFYATSNAYGGRAIIGVASGSAGVGVVGTGSTAAPRAGVLAFANGATVALEVAGGSMVIDNSTLVSNLNAEQVGGKTLAGLVQVASGTSNNNYLYFLNNNTAPSNPTTRAAWIKISTNDGGTVWFPGYV